MRYALNLAEDGRILSVTYPQYATVDAVTVDALPDGDVSNYRYVGGQYVYDPLSEPEQTETEATADDVLNVLLGVTV